MTLLAISNVHGQVKNVKIKKTQPIVTKSIPKDSLKNYSNPKGDLIKYLDAYKTAEFEESKTIINEYSFDQGADYTMTDYSSVTGLTFETNFPNIKGYKALVNCKLKTKAGDYMDKKMLVVMYYDKLKTHYSVFGMQEATDAKSEYENAKTRVDAGEYVDRTNGKGMWTDKEYDYKKVAFWAVMTGQINDAKKYINLAISSASEIRNNSFSTDQIELIIERIM